MDHRHSYELITRMFHNIYASKGLSSPYDSLYKPGYVEPEPCTFRDLELFRDDYDKKRVAYWRDYSNLGAMNGTTIESAYLMISALVHLAWCERELSIIDCEQRHHDLKEAYKLCQIVYRHYLTTKGRDDTDTINALNCSLEANKLLARVEADLLPPPQRKKSLLFRIISLFKP